MTETGSKSPDKKPNRVLACLTSGWARLIILTWAAYMLTTLTMTWYGVTAYHIAGSDIRHDDGTWGQMYDASRSASRTGITMATAVTDVAQGKGAKPKLDDELFHIVDDDFKNPEGWHATLIHSWMVIVTVVNASFALLTWFVVIKNFLVTAFGITRFDADQEKREERQELAADVALSWQILVPFMCWAIQRLTGYSNCGIAPHLYRKMLAIGPMVLIGQKLLVLLMTTLKDAMKALDSSGDVAWTLCSKDLASKTREVKRSAIDIFEKSCVLKKGPMWLQRACQGGFMAAHFETRPYGVVLGILGIVDTVIIGRLTGAILSVIPSWIDETIDKAEAMVAKVGEDASKLNKELDDHLQRIKGVVGKASKVLDEAQDHLKHTRAMVAKNQTLLGEPMTRQMESTIDDVSRPLAEIQADVDLAVSEVKKVEDAIEKDAGKELAKVLHYVKAVTKLIEAFRPENILVRLEKLTDEALYGELIKIMAKDKAAGAPSLAFPHSLAASSA